MPLPLPVDLWDQPASSAQEVDRKHGQGVYRGKAEGPAGLPELHHLAPHSFQQRAGQEISGH